MKSRISAILPEVKNRVRSTLVSGKYSCWLWTYSTGRRLKCPPFSSSRMEQKTLGEPKAGRQSQSMVPSVPTRAAVCRSPTIPWSSIGRYTTPFPQWCRQYYLAYILPPQTANGKDLEHSSCSPVGRGGQDPSRCRGAPEASTAGHPFA